MKDFTYFIKQNKLMISTIRFITYDTNTTIITVYYPYLSVSFAEIKILKTSYIYEADKDHKTYYHKINDPYDWHIHIKTPNKQLYVVLKSLFKMLNLSESDYNSIKVIISGNIDDSKSLQKKIEYPGSNSLEKLQKLKENVQKLNIYYDTFKFDITNPFYNISNYVIRICDLNFQLKTDILDIITLLRKRIPNDKSNLDTCLQHILSIKSRGTKKRSKSRSSRSNSHKEEESMLKTIIKADKTKFDEEFKIDVDNILKSKLIITAITYRGNKGVKFEDYANRRMNIEFAWSLFQHMKDIKIHNVLLNDMISINKYIKQNKIKDFNEICHQHVNINGKTNQMKINVNSKRLSPLN